MGWEYKGHPQFNSVVDECAAILDELKKDSQSHQGALSDTRPTHSRMFTKVTPAACQYLAGNYRGSHHPCLTTYRVQVGPHIGTAPIQVDAFMQAFHVDLAGALQKLDTAAADAKKPGEKAKVLQKIVAVCAATLERFLTIHPYANGNGHTARLLIWILLVRYGRIPVRWTLEKSPPGYGDLIQKYRCGDTKPLMVFILSAIIGA
ncbi:Fic family protein [Rhodoferax sp. BAB1]|uniref:Fic family protein n=1 Tax=Rhodoferax sp. BAB1 TaxID=2741720 RepID=UPI001575DABE|nr:Fic family protein [Rhodoferax sp. BAB1]QKO22612.1 Fic family protein [Rhodoferax sp. BAB1]